ncbi:hypothetical protein DPMN_071106 [Dreissena polymorpha]|uniref:Uncharacterized protein n=1 Tax=Dreissena polymorpha TaxID=45954 RepID=A0A9D4BW14_DREPO|nr:hypothetical protein DPMN_071106 [Dreissena polymorpha]
MLLASKKATGWELSSKDNTTAREGSPDLDTTRKRWTEEQDKKHGQKRSLQTSNS